MMYHRLWPVTTSKLMTFGPSNGIKKGQINPRQCIHFYEINFCKNLESKSVLGFNSSDEITNFTNYVT